MAHFKKAEDFLEKALAQNTASEDRILYATAAIGHAFLALVEEVQKNQKEADEKPFGILLEKLEEGLRQA